jgi:hypothetical protein
MSLQTISGHFLPALIFTVKGFKATSTLMIFNLCASVLTLTENAIDAALFACEKHVVFHVNSCYLCTALVETHYSIFLACI